MCTWIDLSDQTSGTFQSVANFFIVEDKLNYVELPIPATPVPAVVGQPVLPETLAAQAALVKGQKEIVELKTVFSQQAEQELLQTVREFQACKQKEEQSVSSYVLKMKSYIDKLERLGIRRSKKLQPGALSLYMGNDQRAVVEAIGSYDLCFPIGLVIDDQYELGDLNEPVNYKAALFDPEFNKWLNAMNVKMQSMKDNKVWDLVDLPLNDKTVDSKWLFKKKTGMDGAIHIYKARLVAKDFTQTLGIDYKETFSPVADIRAIRILIAISAFYDYEI
nr:putative retrotransposon Ty1-copia subclass protein [Tanacetum cinerariifolium]